MKRLLSILIPAVITVSANAQTGDPNPVDFGEKEPLVIESESGNHEFMVEVADNREKQIHGYMFKESLEPTDGMICRSNNLDEEYTDTPRYLIRQI